MRRLSYRRHLGPAQILWRKGMTFEMIARRIGGNADTWRLLAEVAGDIPASPIPVEIIERAMKRRAAGKPLARIARDLGVSAPELRWQIDCYCGKQKAGNARWKLGRAAAIEVVADWREGLSLDSIRWKYGFASTRVAREAIEEIKKLIDSELEESFNLAAEEAAEGESDEDDGLLSGD